MNAYNFPVKRPLPDQRAFNVQSLPKDILVKIITALNTVLNMKYDLKNSYDFANFIEQLKNKLFEICCEHPCLNNGIYDFSNVLKFIVGLIGDISRDRYYEGRKYEPLSIKLNTQKLKADIARVNAIARRENEYNFLFAPGYLQAGVFSKRIAKLNRKKCPLNVSEDVVVLKKK